MSDAWDNDDSKLARAIDTLCEAVPELHFLASRLPLGFTEARMRALADRLAQAQELLRALRRDEPELH